MPLPTILDGVEPSELGLPARFKTYRPIQREMAQFGVYGQLDQWGSPSEKDYVMMGAPTGCGKSVSAHTIAALCQVKTVILTATNGLLDQQVADKFSMVDIRGKANYTCRMVDERGEMPWTCDEGEDQGCRVSGTARCTYTARMEEAKRARVVLTNYQYWMTMRGRNRAALELPKEPVELLIGDEFHLAANELSRHLGMWLSRENLGRFGDEKLVRTAMKQLSRAPNGQEWARVEREWVELLGVMEMKVAGRMADLCDGQTQAETRRANKEYRTLEKLAGDLSRVGGLGGDGNWIWHPTRNGVSFDCVWPYRYAQRYLFSGVKRVVGMSATLRPKCMALLGLKPADYDYKQWPRVFPANYSPVYYWGLGRMGKNAPEEDVEAVCKGIDELWLARRDQKMMIHSAAYDRAEMFQSKCVEAGRHMILSKPGEAMRAAEKFRKAGAGAVLSSPSFMTGWDFPDDQCRVNVVPKIPFSFRGDPVFQARQSDPAYEMYKVAQDLEQAFGRSTRHDKDRSEGFLLDKAWNHFYYAAKEYFSMGFSVRKIGEIPKCPVKL